MLQTAMNWAPKICSQMLGFWIVIVNSYCCGFKQLLKSQGLSGFREMHFQPGGKISFLYQKGIILIFFNDGTLMKINVPSALLGNHRDIVNLGWLILVDISKDVFWSNPPKVVSFPTESSRHNPFGTRNGWEDSMLNFICKRETREGCFLTASLCSTTKNLQIMRMIQSKRLRETSKWKQNIFAGCITPNQ